MPQITVERIPTGFDESWKYCYVHARTGVAPDGRMVMTTQKLRLSGSDIFSGLEMLSRPSADSPWSPIRPCPELSRRPWKDGQEMAMCDATPYFHKATGRFILTGHAALYKDDELVTGLQRRDPLWSVYDDAKGRWLPFQALELPTEFYESGFGCSQLFEEPDGTLLIPAVTQTKAGKPVPTSSTAGCFVTRCRFDGSTLSLLDMGNIMDLPTGRGLCEPSIAFCGGRYFLCMRNDDTSYVSTSEDGLHFTTPQEWLFDDGSPLGSYNTQQHWLTGWWTRLYLVYTRRAGYNDHIFRHRAPLFMAEVDMERLRVKRDTEQVAVPMRGARLGNFGCCQTSPDSGVITAAEWMQTTGPDPFNYRRCMEFGSDNSIFVSTVNGM